MKINVAVETPLSTSARVKQLSALFDVPLATTSRLEWVGEAPVEAEPWQLGLLVGPSGSGKSTLLRALFGAPADLAWGGKAVVDDFDRTSSMDAISAVCQAVGFNTIPAWMRPYAVLSNGERFRVELARRLLETPPDVPIVVDEFTSVVDRQVAQIGAHAVQKWVRRAPGRQFVAATCHYDVVDWLQPDWLLEPATMTFTRRSVQRRPALDVEVARVPHAAWDLFRRFHYLTASLHRVAKCFVLAVNGQPASFAGMMYRPHPRVRDVWGCSRLVTLPDWQGLGLALILIDLLGACYKARGLRVHTYPAHPALIRAFAKSPRWACIKRPGQWSTPHWTSPRHNLQGYFGGRPNAVFAYTGPAEPDEERVRCLMLTTGASSSPSRATR
jgi:ABC-type Mn2+/Zn2+ transport system ATPase subunit